MTLLTHGGQHAITLDGERQFLVRGLLIVHDVPERQEVELQTSTTGVQTEDITTTTENI